MCNIYVLEMWTSKKSLMWTNKWNKKFRNYSAITICVLSETIQVILILKIVLNIKEIYWSFSTVGLQKRSLRWNPASNSTFAFDLDKTDVHKMEPGPCQFVGNLKAKSSIKRFFLGKKFLQKLIPGLSHSLDFTANLRHAVKASGIPLMMNSYKQYCNMNAAIPGANTCKKNWQKVKRMISAYSSVNGELNIPKLYSRFFRLRCLVRCDKGGYLCRKTFTFASNCCSLTQVLGS